MKTQTPLSCPIGTKQVDENVTRIIALQVVVLISLSLYFQWFWLSGLLMIDFLLRARFDGSGSLLRWIAITVKQQFQLPNKPTNAAPKQFAALIGVFFSAAIALFIYLDWTLFYWTIGSMLLICTLLESIFSYCVGCTIYQLLQRFQLIHSS